MNAALSITLVGLLVASTDARAEELIPVQTLRGHPALHIYRDTIRREGATVSFTYLLETPTGSNAIDATVDCAARSFVTQGARIYPDAGPTGVARPTIQKPWEAIREKSTLDFLAKALCA